MAAVEARTERCDVSFEPVSSVLQRIGKLKKQAAVAHDSVSNGKSLENLCPTGLRLTEHHIAPSKLVAADNHVYERLVVVVAQNGCVRHRDGIGQHAGRYSDRAVHILF